MRGGGRDADWHHVGPVPRVHKPAGNGTAAGGRGGPLGGRVGPGNGAGGGGARQRGGLAAAALRETATASRWVARVKESWGERGGGREERCHAVISVGVWGGCLGSWGVLGRVGAALGRGLPA